MNPTIVLAEGDPRLRRLYRILLERSLDPPPRLLECDNGREAVRLAWKAQPELIILDTNMPVMCGEQVCVELRKDPETAHLRVLLVRGHPPQPGEPVLEDAYQVKPFLPTEFLATVHHLLQENRPEAATSSGKRILLGGPDWGAIELVGYGLECEGHLPVTVHHRVELEQRAEAEAWDLIIVTGTEPWYGPHNEQLAASMRALARFGPVLLLSAYAGLTSMSPERLGVASVQPKPFFVHEFLAVVESILRGDDPVIDPRATRDEAIAPARQR